MKTTINHHYSPRCHASSPACLAWRVCAWHARPAARACATGTGPPQRMWETHVGNSRGKLDGKPGLVNVEKAVKHGHL